MTEQCRRILGQKTYLNAEKNSRFAQATNSWQHNPHRESQRENLSILSLGKVL